MARPEEYRAEHGQGVAHTSENLIADILKGELVFAAEPTISKVMHVDSDTLGLVDTPFSFRVFNLPGRRLHVAAFPLSVSLQGNELIDVLVQARPTKGVDQNYIQSTTQGRVGILSDLEIFTPEGRKKAFGLLTGGSISGQDVYDRHMAADPDFREVEANHAGRYTKAIAASGRKEKESALGNLVLNVYPLEKTVDDYYGGTISDREKFQQLLRDSTMMHRVRLLTPEVGFSKYQPGIVVVSEQDPPQEYTRYKASMQSLEPKRRVLIRKNEDGHIEIKLDGDSVTLAFRGRYGRDSKALDVIDDSIQTESGLVPLIAWYQDKATGDLSYYCGEPIQDEQMVDFLQPEHDSLLGQHVVAAYAKNVNETLEARLPMRGFAGSQDMAEAQMLTHTKRYASRYLQEAPIINGLQALAA